MIYNITMKEWIEMELQKYNETFQDIIFCTIPYDEIKSNDFLIPLNFCMWTRKMVYKASPTYYLYEDSKNPPWELHGLYRDPPSLYGSRPPLKYGNSYEFLHESTKEDFEQYKKNLKKDEMFEEISNDLEKFKNQYNIVPDFHNGIIVPDEENN